MKGLIGVWVTLLFFAWPTLASAQVGLRLSLSSDKAEEGEHIEVRLTASADSDGAASNPRLKVPKGLIVRGPNISNQSNVSIINGSITQKRTLTARWTLTPQKQGQFTIGPATVEHGGQRYQSDAVTLTVVPQGTLPKRPKKKRRRRSPFGGRSPFGLDPFDWDPFGQFPGGSALDDLLREPEEEELDFPEEFRVERAPDQDAFLRAKLDRRQVYLGEQLTLRVYAYGGLGPFQEGLTHEPDRPDFYTHDLLDAHAQRRQVRVPIGDQVFFAQKVRELGLFALETGELKIGPMSFEFVGARPGFRRRGYQSRTGKGGLERQSQPLSVRVIEPPKQGRPPGYSLGDVGRFKLTGTAEPRSVEAGGAISVTIQLTGEGRLPARLKVPNKKGVDFLDPTLKDQVGAREGRLVGSRTFSYIVRLTEPGAIDLGEITLPYFDPKSERYAIARTSLGVVQVTPAKTPTETPRENAGPDASERLLTLATPKRELGPTWTSDSYLSDRPYFSALALAPPACVGIGFFLVGLGRRARTRLEMRRGSHATAAQRALKEAKGKARDGQYADTASLLERAVYLALESSTGIKGRGVLRAELGAALEERGVEASTADRVVAFLDDCDTARFTASDAGAADTLYKTGNALVSSLLGLKPRNGKSA